MWLPLLLSCAGSPSAVARVCKPGAAWTPGTQAFREATSDWGLDAIGADGVRIEAVDYDGDGWPDLAVRKDIVADDWVSGVRNHWLLRNDGAGHFVDMTRESGILARRDGNADLGRPGPVWAWADVDNDGDLDVYTGLPDDGGTETETSDLLLNAGDGTFVLAPKGGDLRNDEDDQPFGAAFTDVDRDGHIDLWIGQGATSAPRQSELYLGDGTGHFNKVTHKWGLDTLDWNDTVALDAGLAHANAWSAAACDLDGVNGPDLLVSSYGRAPNLLFTNQGDGTFANVSVTSGYAYDERVDWSDNESARCWCTLHPTDADCAGVPPPAVLPCTTDADAFRWDHDTDRSPYRLGGNSGATMCGDVDNDGRIDLLTTEIVHWDVGSSADPSELLFQKPGAKLTFERPGNEVTGLTRTHEDPVIFDDGDMTGSLFDFDLDGWTDVLIGSSDYVGTRALLWRQTGPRTFDAVPKKNGLDHTRSHGSAIADFDRDGDLDVVLGHSSARCEEDCYPEFHVRLFENLMGDQANWTSLHLVGGAGANRAAIGARVELTAGGTTQTRLVDGGHGQWGAQDDLTLTFGLGTACEADVVVRWPDAPGTIDRFHVVAGQRYLVPMGQLPVVE